MAIVEVPVLDQIILEPTFGNVLWRVTTYIIKDGTEIIGKQYFRSSLGILQVTPPPEWPAYLDQFRALIDTPTARALAQLLHDRATQVPMNPNTPAPLPTTFPPGKGFSDGFSDGFAVP